MQVIAELSEVRNMGGGLSTMIVILIVSGIWSFLKYLFKGKDEK